MSFRFVGGNRVRLLESGTHYFPALEAAIDGALEEIHLETYIFADDSTGRRIADALARAARRGVLVHVLVDGFGARDFMPALGNRLLAEGVRVLVYRPDIGWLSLRRNRLRRLHRKLVVVDGRIGFVGGINVIDDMDTPGQVPPRYDYAVQVEGPEVAAIHETMKRLWHRVQWATLQRRPAPPRPPAPPKKRGTVKAALVIRDNVGHRRDIERAYLRAIGRARQEIILASAYFLPGRRMRQALAAAARRGVRVEILLQGKVEYALLHYATQYMYARMLGADIHLHEYTRSFLHAKVAVIDGHWATVGSSNIDPFSLLLAREANLVVRDREFAGTLRASLRHAMRQGAREVVAADLRRRSWRTRLFSHLAYLLVRMAIGITRYGGDDYRE